jgi:hypothetical protein
MENENEEKKFDPEGVAERVTENYSVSRPQIDKVRYTHNAMVDLLITNPGISQDRIAQYFGYSPSWVCTILASDAFQVQLARRRHELIDPSIAATIEERFKALAETSVNKLIEHINRPMVNVDPEILIKAAALGAKALGIGGNAAAKTVVISSDERLQALSGRLTGLLRKQNEEIINVEVKEINRGEAGSSSEESS